MLLGILIGCLYVSGSFSMVNNGVIVYIKGNEYCLVDLGYLYKGKIKMFILLNEDILGYKKLGKVYELNVKL